MAREATATGTLPFPLSAKQDYSGWKALEIVKEANL
jgi:hypothetical protein